MNLSHIVIIIGFLAHTHTHTKRGREREGGRERGRQRFSSLFPLRSLLSFTSAQERNSLNILTTPVEGGYMSVLPKHVTCFFLPVGSEDSLCAASLLLYIIIYIFVPVTSLTIL